MKLRTAVPILLALGGLALLPSIRGCAASRRSPPAFDPVDVVLQQVTAGLRQPVFITNAGDGSGRLFVLERAGKNPHH